MVCDPSHGNHGVSENVPIYQCFCFPLKAPFIEDFNCHVFFIATGYNERLILKLSSWAWNIPQGQGHVLEKRRLDDTPFVPWILDVLLIAPFIREFSIESINLCWIQQISTSTMWSPLGMFVGLDSRHEYESVQMLELYRAIRNQSETGVTPTQLS